MKSNKKKVYYIDQLLKKPQKDKKNKSTFPTTLYKPNFIHQIDLLFLPYDEYNKERYSLVVIDMSTRLIDAEPIKSKDSKSVVDAIKKIYKRKILKQPSQIDSDSGSEFQGEFKTYLKENNIKHKIALPNRHSQIGLVENANKRIAKPLFRRMLQEELLTGESSVSWKTELKDVVDDINKLTIKRNKIKELKEKKKPKPDILDEFKCSGDACNLIPEGTKVRYLLDSPIDFKGKKIGSKFRETDIRWSLEEHKVTRILLKPNQPPLYLLNNNPNIAYRKDQIQIILPSEIMPHKKNIRPKGSKKGKDVYIIDKIIDKRKVKNKVEYLVTWKGFDVEDATWEPRTQLIQDGQLGIITTFENNQKLKK